MSDPRFFRKYLDILNEAGGFWAQGPAKTVNTDLGPITQRQKQYVATPTPAELISKGLQGTQSELEPVTAAQAFPKTTPNPNSIQSATTGQSGIEKTTPTPGIQSATTKPQDSVQEDEVEKIKNFIRK